MRDLRFHENKIERIEGLEDMTELDLLTLSNNQIGRIEGLERLVHLRELHLGVNRIPRIEGLDTLVNLRELTLYGNRITCIEGLHHLECLEHLDLQHNRMVDPRDKALAEVLHLKWGLDELASWVLNPDDEDDKVIIEAVARHRANIEQARLASKERAGACLNQG